MNLGVAGICEVSPALVAAPGRRHIGIFRVGRQVIHVAIAAGAEQHRIAAVTLQLAGHQIAGDNAARLPVNHHQIQHFLPGEDLHLPHVDLPHQGAIGPQQKLLPSLPPRVKGAGNQCAPKRTVREQTAILPRKGHPLGHALVDDVAADLRQPIHVGLAGAVVAALDGVVKQPPHAVAVVGIVFGGVDAALRRDAVGATGRILNAKAFDVVAQFAQGGRCRSSREPGTHDQHRMFALVVGAHQGTMFLKLSPLVA